MTCKKLSNYVIGLGKEFELGEKIKTSLSLALSSINLEETSQGFDKNRLTALALSEISYELSKRVELALHLEIDLVTPASIFNAQNISYRSGIHEDGSHYLGHGAGFRKTEISESQYTYNKALPDHLRNFNATNLGISLRVRLQE